MKIMELWNKLNGNKTAIGMVMLLTLQGVKLAFPNLMSSEVYDYLVLIANAIGGVGVGHKIVKSYGKN